MSRHSMNTKMLQCRALFAVALVCVVISASAQHMDKSRLDCLAIRHVETSSMICLQEILELQGIPDSATRTEVASYLCNTTSVESLAWARAIATSPETRRPMLAAAFTILMAVGDPLLSRKELGDPLRLDGVIRHLAADQDFSGRDTLTTGPDHRMPKKYLIGVAQPLTSGTLAEMRTFLAEAFLHDSPNLFKPWHGLAMYIYLDQTGDVGLLREIWNKTRMPFLRRYLVELLADARGQGLVQFGYEKVEQIARSSDPDLRKLAPEAVKFLQMRAYYAKDINTTLKYLRNGPGNLYGSSGSLAYCFVLALPSDGITKSFGVRDDLEELELQLGDAGKIIAEILTNSRAKDASGLYF